MFKKFLIASSLLFSLASQAGPFVSGGPVGHEILNCTAQTNKGVATELRIRVFAQIGEGLVARLLVNNVVNQENLVTQDPWNPRGILYAGNPISVLIPNIQNPRNPPGTYQVIVSVNGKGSFIANCNR